MNWFTKKDDSSDIVKLKNKLEALEQALVDQHTKIEQLQGDFLLVLGGIALQSGGEFVLDDETVRAYGEGGAILRTEPVERAGKRGHRYYLEGA